MARSGSTSALVHGRIGDPATAASPTLGRDIHMKTPQIKRLGNPLSDRSKPDWCNLKWLASITGADDGIVGTYFIVAANRLVEIAVKKVVERPDCLFMPIAYLYRHGTELMLKDIIQLGKAIGVIHTADYQKYDLNREHRLDVLWSIASIGLKRRWPKGSSNSLKKINTIISDLHTMDPSGQGFRYSRDTKKRMNMNLYPDSVVLSDLRSAMGNVFELLENCREEFLYDLSEMEI